MALPSGLPDAVADDEELARFLASSSHFSRQGVRAAAFLPNPRDQETSVFRAESTVAECLWALGRGHLPRVHGAAVLTALAVRRAQLEVTASEPPPRHAAIVSWPWMEDLELQKAEQKERALQLCQASRLLLA